MPKVFVAQEPKPGKQNFTYDISPCLQFGQPVMVFNKEEQPSLTPGPSIHHARRVLAEMTDKDFLLWAGGDPAALVIVSAVMASITGKINFLRWEKERGTDGQRTGRGFYLPVSLNLREKVV